MDIHRYLFSNGTTPPIAPCPRTGDPADSMLRRSEPLRCLLISCLSVLAGGLLLYVLQPFLSDEAVTGILANHLPGSHTHPVLYWLRLCGVRFPFWLLLVVAGFTRFSGGLTTAVLGYRGICDGMAMGLLWLMYTGHIKIVLPTALTPLHICITYGIWLVLGLLIRLILALGARRMAREAIASVPLTGRMEPRLRELLWRYLALCLGGLCATLTSCGIYTAFLYI